MQNCRHCMSSPGVTLRPVPLPRKYMAQCIREGAHPPRGGSSWETGASGEYGRPCLNRQSFLIAALSNAGDRASTGSERTAGLTRCHTKRAFPDHRQAVEPSRIGLESSPQNPSETREGINGRCEPFFGPPALHKTRVVTHPVPVSATSRPFSDSPGRT